ncbi:MAG: hypothetical protein M1837_007370 [Sclerophora amabilis]|nr:MAG: hypothetical protein M1837_007370 [Sclerophora amabilis]
MASFADITPFPDDVPTATLPRLSLNKLVNGDCDESERLFEACRDLGFFYLDLEDHEQGMKLLRIVDGIFAKSDALFDMSIEEKQKHRLITRYKPFGGTITDRTGAADRCEFLDIANSAVLPDLDSDTPGDALTNSRSDFKDFVVTAHLTAESIMERIDETLHLPRGTLAKLHRLEQPGGSQARIAKFPSQLAADRRVSFFPHTDFGTLTILFNRLGGLQILPPPADATWRYVRPIPGHAIVNLGDAMVKFTGSLMRSALHRVTYGPGAQAEQTRYSLGYFLRPEDCVILKRLEGSDVIPHPTPGEVSSDEALSSKEWLERRFSSIRHDSFEPEKWQQTRGTETQSQLDVLYYCDQRTS